MKSNAFHITFLLKEHIKCEINNFILKSKSKASLFSIDVAFKEEVFTCLEETRVILQQYDSDDHVLIKIQRTYEHLLYMSKSLKTLVVTLKIYPKSHDLSIRSYITDLQTKTLTLLSSHYAVKERRFNKKPQVLDKSDSNFLRGTSDSHELWSVFWRPCFK